MRSSIVGVAPATTHMKSTLIVATAEILFRHNNLAVVIVVVVMAL